MSGAWTNNSKYTVTVQGIASTDGDVMQPFEWWFYSPMSPLWGNPDVIAMDLRGYISTVEENILYYYMHEASLDAYRAIENNPNLNAPDPSKTLDQLCDEGYNTQTLAYIECYVRWRTQFLLLSNAIANAAASGGTQKILGDFSIKSAASPITMREGLRQVIEPNMNECFLPLAGEQKTKAGPKVRIRGSSHEAVRATTAARSLMRPGFVGPRNWDWLYRTRR